MKIAIQGDLTRGKEIISILESLGGINRMNHSGRYPNCFYYISGDNNTIAWTTVRPQHLGVFTLEEFEKEFPFKVGDRVISITTGCIGTITKCNKNGCCYVKYDNGNTACAFGQYLKLYKEMERNITLTLEKAKEWYKKGGELKEIALQAFTEKELTKVDLPKTWEEFCEKYPVKSDECWLDSHDRISMCTSSYKGNRIFKNWIPSKKSAEAHLAMIQLEQLRNCWWNDWEPEWSNCEKYIIKWDKNDLMVFTARNIHAFLVFPTREMAEEFLICFRNLIEKAGDLI